jgi:hypothetical protein
MGTKSRETIRTVYFTKSVRIGIILTLITGATLAFLVFVEKHFFSILMLASVIAFQLCFIWTCAELLDGPDEELSKDEERGGDFSH